MILLKGKREGEGKEIPVRAVRAHSSGRGGERKDAASQAFDGGGGEEETPLLWTGEEFYPSPASTPTGPARGGYFMKGRARFSS